MRALVAGDTSDALKQGCATFFVGGPYNQLQTSSWATRKIYFFNINCRIRIFMHDGEKSECWQGPH